MNKEKQKYLLIQAISGVSPEDKMFAVLLASGYPAYQAYIASYKTNASVNSAAALASRKANSWQIQAILKTMQSLYLRGEIAFPHQLIKE